MEERDIESFRELLLARKRELIDEGDVAIQPGITEANARQDEDTQPLNEMSQVIASRRNKTRLAQLEKIEHALMRLDASPDDFGECRDCGDEIPIARLEVVPWADFCVTCQDERSTGRGRGRRHLRDYIE